MSEFAQIDAAGVVVQVILADESFIASGLVGEPASWVPVVPEGAAGIGFSFDALSGQFSASAAPSASEAKEQLKALLEAATAPILDAYPPAEQLSWDAKEIEAAAFTTAAAAAAVDGTAPTPLPADYPMLRGEVAAEMMIAAVDVTIEQLADKVEAVLWMASQWRALISALSGIRKRAETAIEVAEDRAGRRAAVEAAEAAIGDLVGW
jgi:hypothetical protein